MSTVIAHELVHGLGAVRACAPHASPDGHVTDDPADIVHVRALQVSPHLLVLDAGRDDYFGHGMDDWYGGGDDFDADVRALAADWHEALRSLPAETFLTDPDTALAAAILFDQVPRNIYRGT